MKNRAAAGIVMLSGCCALMYQTAWMRLFRMVFGTSTAATAAVLAVFMGGLGLGAFVLGKRMDRTHRPLSVFVRLEFGVMILAAVSPLLVGLIGQFYMQLGGSFNLGVPVGTLSRLVMVALTIGLPAFLMGGTLPAMVRGMGLDRDERRAAVGILYGANTIGAVAGVLLTTFFFIEWMGVSKTIWLACGFNGIVVGLAHWLASTQVTEVTQKTEEVSPTKDKSTHRLLYGVAAATGFCFLLMELVWYRMLGSLLGGSSYTFGLILATALLGVGIGGWLYGLFDSGRPTFRTLAITCALEAIAVVFPLAMGETIPYLALFLRDVGDLGFAPLIAAWSMICCMVVLPAAIVAGYQFPLLVALAGKSKHRLGEHIGMIYSFNTLGAIIGSIAGGFGLLPLLSAPGAWRLVAVLLASLTVGLVMFDRRRIGGPIGLVMLAFGLTLTGGPTAIWRHVPIGAGRAPRGFDDANHLQNWVNQVHRELGWQADGVESSIALSTGNSGHAFIINGKSDGAAVGDAPTQVMGGLVGTLLHPAPTTGLVIGMGTGSTAGWMAQVETMSHVDVVELEPLLLDVAQACDTVNGNMLENPRVAIHLGDAREYVLGTQNRYDVVFSEPSNPYRAGVSGLFSLEFYQHVAQILNEDGIFLQWLQAYEIDVQTAQTVIATLGTAFPHVELWQTHRQDLLLVASAQSLEHAPQRVEQRMSQAPYKDIVPAVWGVGDAAGFYSAWLSGPQLAQDLVRAAKGNINTDEHPIVEFGFARGQGRAPGFSVQSVRRLNPSERPSPKFKLDWNRVVELRTAMALAISAPITPVDELLNPSDWRISARSAYANGDLEGALYLWRGQTSGPLAPIDAVMVAEAMSSMGETVEESLGLHPVDQAVVTATAHRALTEWDKATDHLVDAFDLYRGDPWGNWQVMTRGLLLAESIALTSQHRAQRLSDALALPFASGSLNELRLASRARIGANLQTQCVTTLDAYAMWPLWEEDLLRQRVNCYAAAQHAHLPTAQKDLQRFVEYKRKGLGE